MTVLQNAEQAFNRDAASYDAGRRALIPCFDGFYGNVVEVIHDWGARENARVLDLGAGTGLLTATVMPALPGASYTLTDISDEMLARARSRFDGVERIAYLRSDLSTDQLDGEWDLIISALAIHHLSDEDKQGLYQRAFDRLAPGGLFINAEQVLGPTADQEAQYKAIWERQIRAAGVDDSGVQQAKERMAFDRCSTVADQLQWLSKAGFSRVDCTFKAWRFAVLAAWKD